MSTTGKLFQVWNNSDVTFHDIVTQQDIKAMFVACSHTSSFEHVALRDRAILTILYSCGLRRNEAYHLNLNDVMIAQSQLLVRKGKNYQQRIVPLNDYTLMYWKPICMMADPTSPMEVIRKLSW